MTGEDKETRSTKVRAAIMRFLNQNPDREFTMADIMAALHDLIADCEYKETNVYSFLHQMTKHSQVNMRKAGAINMYSSKNRPSLPSVQETPTATATVPDVNPPHLKLDIIKSTGNVRLEFGGLIIEIGVKP